MSLIPPEPITKTPLPFTNITLLLVDDSLDPPSNEELDDKDETLLSEGELELSVESLNWLDVLEVKSELSVESLNWLDTLEVLEVE